MLETRTEWYEALAEVFGLELTDLDAADRETLWARVHSAHEARSAHAGSQDASTAAPGGGVG